MPIIDWEAFQESHHRPYVAVGTVATEAEAKAALLLLVRLAERMAFVGRYAFQLQGMTVRAAFERSADADDFSDALKARGATPGIDWASQSTFTFDNNAKRRVSSALKEYDARPARRPTA